MNVSFKDFYGQHININDETASGNIRLRVRTCKSLNDVRQTTEAACDIETDISLNRKQLDFLISTLRTMQGEDE